MYSILCDVRESGSSFSPETGEAGILRTEAELVLGLTSLVGEGAIGVAGISVDLIPIVALIGSIVDAVSTYDSTTRPSAAPRSLKPLPAIRVPCAVTTLTTYTCCSSLLTTRVPLYISNSVLRFSRTFLSPCVSRDPPVAAGAAVTIYIIPIIALLGARDFPIPTGDEAADPVAAVPLAPPAVGAPVALFPHIFLDDAVPAAGELTAVGAGVIIDRVAIVTPLGTRTKTHGEEGAPEVPVATAVHDAVSATGLSAIGSARVCASVRVLWTIVALLSGIHNAVPADTPRGRSSSLGRGTFPATHGGIRCTGSPKPSGGEDAGAAALPLVADIEEAITTRATLVTRILLR